MPNLIFLRELLRLRRVHLMDKAFPKVKPVYRQEWGICERGETEPGLLSFDREHLLAQLCAGETLTTRYVTDWKADNE